MDNRQENAGLAPGVRSGLHGKSASTASTVSAIDERVNSSAAPMDGYAFEAQLRIDYDLEQLRMLADVYGVTLPATFPDTEPVEQVIPIAHHVDVSGNKILPVVMQHTPSQVLSSYLAPIAAADNEADTTQHVVDKWIPADELTLMAGHGGSGKSYCALSLVLHVALGRSFGMLSTTRSKVLYVSAEDSSAVVRQRIRKLCKALPVDPEELANRLHILDLSDADPTLYRNKASTPLLHELSALVTKLDVGLIVLDNASDLFAGDEIRRTEVREFVRTLRQHLARPGRAVLLLAHVNKQAANWRSSAGSEDYSGSTAWHNSVRSRLSLHADGDDRVRIEHAKSNYGSKAEAVTLQWRDGVPHVVGIFDAQGRADQIARDDADRAALVALIQDCDRRGERVPTASRGPNTAYKTLRTMHGFPVGLSSDTLTVFLRQLETEGRLFRVWIKTPNYKRIEVFTCVPPVDMGTGTAK